MSGLFRLLLILVLSASSAFVATGPAQVTAEARLLQAEDDVVPPVISGATDVTVEAIDSFGAIVSYVTPAITDDTDPNPTISCRPGSGAVFPLGTSIITCIGTDSARNTSNATFAITVVDRTPPSLPRPVDLVVDASDSSGATADFIVPEAFDSVSGYVAVICDVAPGSLVPIGNTWVTCSASDTAGNLGTTGFTITVLALEPTEIPASATPEATKSSEKRTETPSPSPTATTESTSTPTSTPTPLPTAAALVLSAPIPDFALVTDGGPLGVLTTIWGDHPSVVSQEYGHTAFSIANFGWYWYGRSFGLDGFQHTGLDIAMPAGTALYSPISGTVKVAGGQPFFTYYGNGLPGVGELLIETDSGDQVILGHLGLITVNVGDRVEIGQFVGLSGGFNGDHLHLETRTLEEGGWFLIVDPRQSFVVTELEAAAAKLAADDK